MTTLPEPGTPYYGGGQVKNPADVIQRSGAPSTLDNKHNLGTLYVNQANGNSYILNLKPAGAATWSLFTGPNGSVISIAGNSGSAVPTSAGVVTISGGTTGLTTSGSASTLSLTGTLNVANGGTGATSLTDHGVLVGSGTAAVTPLAVGTTGQVLIGATGADPAFGALGVNSNLTGLVVGNTNSAFTAASFTAATAWTPDLQINGSSTGITYATQSAFYTRIGNAVYVSGEITLTSKGASVGNVTISNLPVITGASGSVNTIGAWGSSITLSANYTNIQIDLANASQVGSLFMSGSGQVTSAITDAMLANNSTINFSGVYFLN